jgi:hypothetical protein
LVGRNRISWLELTFVGGVAQAEGVELRLFSESVSIDSADCATVVDDPSVSGAGRGIGAWWNPHTEVVLVGADISEALYAIYLKTCEISLMDYLFRDEDEGLRFLSFHPADDGSLVLLYERGVLCVTDAGTLRWHRLHDDLSAYLVSASDGVVVIERQWPVAEAGKRMRFRLVDGAELGQALPDDGPVHSGGHPSPYTREV